MLSVPSDKTTHKKMHKDWVKGEGQGEGSRGVTFQSICYYCSSVCVCVCVCEWIY